MSKKTRTAPLSDEQLRSIFLNARDSAQLFERLLLEAEEADDDNLFRALSDARNVMEVLTHRTAWKLRLPSSHFG